ncbi:hypothetical protein CLV72_11222 [Allonocardiopsis opalescens]|uniref:Uncharacterized protein n=1 Tax=Allonocardiopsis opalescens TaxID=1144618 RepID=A0A2T0PSS9_9ACTN|nr:hypothetical protein CLV72_11222 [Allonocardiopsis opalescens]
MIKVTEDMAAHEIGNNKVAQALLRTERTVRGSA